jgi:hypothetical protein
MDSAPTIFEGYEADSLTVFFSLDSGEHLGPVTGFVLILIKFVFFLVKVVSVLINVCLLL